MTIRVFMCQWTETQTADGLDIDNPIDAYLRDRSLSDPNTIGANFYARMSQAHRPDKLYMLKAMRGNLTNAEWTTLSNLGGVRMVPPSDFDKPTADLNNPTRNQINNALDALGVPRTVLTSSATIGGFLRNVLAELDPGNVGFGNWELDAAEWA